MCDHLTPPLGLDAEALAAARSSAGASYLLVGPDPSGQAPVRRDVRPEEIEPLAAFLLYSLGARAPWSTRACEGARNGCFEPFRDISDDERGRLAADLAEVARVQFAAAPRQVAGRRLRGDREGPADAEEPCPEPNSGLIFQEALRSTYDAYLAEGAGRDGRVGPARVRLLRAAELLFGLGWSEEVVARELDTTPRAVRSYRDDFLRRYRDALRQVASDPERTGYPYLAAHATSFARASLEAEAPLEEAPPEEGPPEAGDHPYFDDCGLCLCDFGLEQLAADRAPRPDRLEEHARAVGHVVRCSACARAVGRARAPSVAARLLWWLACHPPHELASHNRLDFRSLYAQHLAAPCGRCAARQEA